jgi:hypothetical protein
LGAEITFVLFAAEGACVVLAAAHNLKAAVTLAAVDVQ